jgi:hypothetical protein
MWHHIVRHTGTKTFRRNLLPSSSDTGDSSTLKMGATGSSKRYGLFNRAVSSSASCRLEDDWITNLKGYEGKRSWPDLRYYTRISLQERKFVMKTSVGTVGRQAEIWSQDLPKIKQECYPLDRDIGRYHTENMKGFYKTCIWVYICMLLLIKLLHVESRKVSLKHTAQTARQGH